MSPSERLLPDNYQCYPGCTYVMDGKVIRNTVEKTVAELKVLRGVKEIRYYSRAARADDAELYPMNSGTTVSRDFGCVRHHGWKSIKKNQSS